MSAKSKRKAAAAAAAKAAAAASAAKAATPAAAAAPKAENKMVEKKDGARARQMTARSRSAGARGPVMSRVSKGVRGLQRRRFI